MTSLIRVRDVETFILPFMPYLIPLRFQTTLFTEHGLLVELSLQFRLSGMEDCQL